MTMELNDEDEAKGSGKATSSEDQVILYDINTFTHPNWISEINLNKELNAYAKYQKSRANPYHFVYKLTSWFKNKFNAGSDQSTLKFLFTSSKPWNQWKLAVSKSGCFALLRENFIEFYENLENIVWRIAIKTKFVKICNIFLDESAEMLVYSDEYGNIFFLDARDGSEMFRHTETKYIEYEYAICQMFFLDQSEHLDLSGILPDKESNQLVVSLTYSGYLNVYAINKSSKSISKIYHQSMLNRIPHGIYCAEIDANREYILVGSFVTQSSKKSNADVSCGGVSVWRVLNSEPWIKHVPLRDDCDSKKLPKINFKIEYVTKLELSPDNTSLAAIYNSGKIAIYSLPTLRLIREWFMTEQPSYNEANEDVMENPLEFKKFKMIYRESDYRVSDIGWWNRNVLILTRGTGLLSLVSAGDLTSLMGSNHQWLNPFPSLYQYLPNEFILLDCACTLVSMNSSNTNIANLSNLSRNSDDNLSTSSRLNSDSSSIGEPMSPEDDIMNSSVVYEENETYEDDNEDEDSWLTYAKQLVKSQAYNWIGLERFKLPPKKIKVLKRKFSLLHIKSTTPEELFERKLNLGEYGEALLLAKAYGLDTDLVYQKQWRSSQITKSSILDYLSKIKKRSWILHECEQRVSPNIDTTKFLIEFGLHGTDLDSMIALNETDDNRFVYSRMDELSDDEDDEDGESFDKFNPVMVKKRNNKLELRKTIKLTKLSPNALTPGQKQLILIRHKLLSFMDRLNIYEEILGGAKKAAELFDAEKFVQIRSKPILDVVIDYAREGDSRAVEILLTYCHKELQPNYLRILANFPETINPDTYSYLLPKLRDQEVCLFDDQASIRDEKDWIELEEYQQVLESLQSDKNNADNLNDISVDPFTPENIEKWYLNRAVEIENLSGLVDTALRLTELAVENGFNKNASILQLDEDLRTLFTLIYECKPRDGANVFYSLDLIRSKSRLERLCLIMSHSFEPSNEMYVKNLKEWLIPYVARCATTAERNDLLRQYLTKVSKEELYTCVKLIKLKISNANQPQTVINHLLNEVQLVSIVLDCFYVNESPQQVDLCTQLVNEILNQTDASKIGPLSMEILERIKHVQDYLKACDIFKKYGVPKTLAYIRESCQSVDECRQALVKLTWFASKRSSHIKLGEWYDLMKDLRSLQVNLYKSLVTYQDCTEICLKSLLGSRNIENIKLGAEWLRDIYNCDKRAAVDIAIQAAQEYFNSCSNYYDPDMDFARACLDLIVSILDDSRVDSDNGHEIKEFQEMINREWNLIKAMQLITDEFSYNILPVQVRVGDESGRLELVKDILWRKKVDNIQAQENYYEFNPNSYVKLLRLAEYLDLSDINRVLLLTAEYTLLVLDNKSNFTIMKEMCHKLIKASYASAWRCVHKLAFYLAVNLAEQNKIDSSEKGDVYLSIASHKFVSTTSGISGAVAVSIGASNSKEKIIKQLNEIESLLSFCLINCDADSVQDILYEKLNIEKARISLELSRIDEELEKSIKQANSTSIMFETTHSKHISLDFELNSDQASLKSNTYMLHSLLKRLESAETSKHRVQIVNYLSKTEHNLSIASLLELPDDKFLSLFSSIPSSFTNKSFEILLFIICMRIVRSEPLSMSNQKSFVYDIDFKSLLGYVEQFMTDDKENKYADLFSRLNHAYTEHNQTVAMDKLNMGIDLARFEHDDQYKSDTILGLSMDVSTFQLACSLAKFYSFDLWLVYSTFVENVLSNLSVEEIDSSNLFEEQIRPLLPVLRQRSSQYESLLYKNVFKGIEGTDLSKLLIFYQCLNDEQTENHVKIIKKLQSMLATRQDHLARIDYKQLLLKPYEIIEPYLSSSDESTLQVFAKLLPKLPVMNSQIELRSSKLYAVWCLNKFWSGLGPKSDEEGDETLKSLVNDTFDYLTESVKKLDSGRDYIYFVKQLTLSQRAVERLNITNRRELLKKLHQQFKHQQFNSEQISQSTANAVFLSLQNHLKLADSLRKFVNKNWPQSQRFVQQLDTKLGDQIIETNKVDEASRARIVEEFLSDLLLDGCSIELTNQLISEQFNTSETTIKKLIKQSLNRISCNIVEKKQPALGNLNTLLESISQYLKEEDKVNTVLYEEDVMECMRSFCNDQQIDISVRLLILEQLNRIITRMSESDLILLLVYKTNAILENSKYLNGKLIPAAPIEADRIESELKRSEFLSELVQVTSDHDDYSVLLNLIKVWPRFTMEPNPLHTVLVKLVKSSVINLASLIDDFKSNNPNIGDSWPSIKELVHVQNDSGSNPNIRLAFLQLCILLRNETNDSFVKSLLKSSDSHHTEMFESGEESRVSELVNVLTRNKTYIEIINTSMFNLFAEYLIKNETDKSRLVSVVRELKSSGHELEAASLLTRVEDFFQGYRSLSVSMSLVDRF